MKRSIFERIFPAPSNPLLSQHELTEPFMRGSSRSPVSPPCIRMHDTVPIDPSGAFGLDRDRGAVSDTSSSPKTKRSDLQTAPLSASVLHHDDPFLPVERAARALQDSIQSLLDIQSRELSGRMNGTDQETVMSGGSLTPTPSVITPRSSSKTGTIPIRQPVQKRIGLRGARKGLGRKMQEFAELRGEELQILDTQTRARSIALERVEELEARKEACTAEIQSICQEDTSTAVSNLRAEAQNVSSEIEELEHKLLKLRVRHRHLLSQADRLESTQESRISSFQGTIAMVEKETRGFLRRPPVSQALADGSDVKGLGMYALKPERRTLEMAKEQWSSEQETLSQRRMNVAEERTALLDGENMWTEAIKRIDNFEQNLRKQTAELSKHPETVNQHSMDEVLDELDEVIISLESDLEEAESNNWNLLVCAVGAELDTFHQAREMLAHTQQIVSSSREMVSPNKTLISGSSDVRSRSVLLSTSPNGSVGSNQSLRDTLDEFTSQPLDTTKIAQKNITKYESEDDEPPADFFLSH